jgi:hypothetical protein
MLRRVTSVFMSVLVKSNIGQSTRKQIALMRNNHKQRKVILVPTPENLTWFQFVLNWRIRSPVTFNAENSNILSGVAILKTEWRKR